MRVSWNWLKEHIDLDGISVEEVSKALTDAGLEVESIEALNKVSGDLVVALIKSTEKHPNADSLKLCDVQCSDDPSQTLLRIVCGAPNARAGIKVALAKINCVLPGNFKIKASKIRGESSEGMLCSEKELGLSDEHEGILEISSEVPLGTSVSELYAFNDTVLTLNITPNRSDCLSMSGVARDLSAKLKRKLLSTSNSKSKEVESSLVATLPTKSKFKIDTDVGCSHFVSLVAEGDFSKIKTPASVVARLEGAGMRSISPLVDVSNYAMLDLGHPNHIYDARSIPESTLGVRYAKQGEVFQTLDGKSHKLEPTDLLVCDVQGKALGLAGIMGGNESEVKEDTQKIVIEAAVFDHVAIRKTAKRLGIKTEASFRFERGVDANTAKQAVLLIACLLTEWGTDIRLSDISYYTSHGKSTPKAIALRIDRLRSIIGLPHFKADEAQQILERLGFSCADRNNDRLLFEVPSWRHDIEREIDLIEEVARIYGYDKVPYVYAPMKRAPETEHPAVGLSENLRTILANLGLRETISFPFLSAKDLSGLNLNDSGNILSNAVALANPIADTDTHLQTTLLAPLIRALQFNRNHNRLSARLFEVGRCFADAHKIAASTSKNLRDFCGQQPGFFGDKTKTENRPIESLKLALIVDQPWEDKLWYNQGMSFADFFHTKAIIETLCEQIGLDRILYKALSEHDQKDFPFLHPLQSALLYAGEIFLGFVGTLHPQSSEYFDLRYKKHDPLVCELNIDALLNAKNAQSTREKNQIFAEKFPPSTRDLSFIVSRGTPHQKVVDVLLNNPQKRNLKSVQLFDVYKGDSIAAGKQSMTYALVFQSPKRTLNDKEVELEMDMILKNLEQGLGAELRK